MRKMKDSGIAWIGEIPEHWKCCQIKYFGDIVGGTGFPLEYQGNTEEIYPFYKVSDLELSSDGKFLTTPKNSISEEIAKLIHAKIVRKKSIVYAKIGAALLLNRRRIIIKDSIIDNNMSAFTPISDINLNWCFYLFTVIDFSIFIYPGTVPSFSEGAQSRIKIPVPLKDTQDKISAYLDTKCAEIDRSMELARQGIDTLKAYRMSVITEAVTKGLDPDVPMKDSGVPWIGEIPEGWEVRKFKDIFIFDRGLPITKENLIETGIPVLSYGQIHAKKNTGTTVNTELLRFVSQIYLDTHRESLLNVGDILFADTSEDYDGIGNSIYIDLEQKIFAGYHTIICRPIINLQTKYLPYLFQTDVWRSQIRANVSGIKVFSITQKLLRDTFIIFPPLSEQHRIAAYLDAKCAEIDAIIARKQELLDKLAAYKKSLIYECVTGKREVAA